MSHRILIISTIAAVIGIGLAAWGVPFVALLSLLGVR